MEQAAELRLIRRAKRGDGDAIEALIREHQRGLYAFMLRLSGKPDIAEDMVQEAFVRVLRNIDRFDERYRFSTWIFTIARRLFVNYLQKHKPYFDSDRVGAEGAKGGQPGRASSGDELRDHLRVMLDDALDVLTPAQREVVVLFHHFDWSIQDISEALDMPEGTIKSHLHRARKRMHGMICADETQLARAEAVMEGLAR